MTWCAVRLSMLFERLHSTYVISYLNNVLSDVMTVWFPSHQPPMYNPGGRINITIVCFCKQLSIALFQSNDHSKHFTTLVTFTDSHTLMAEAAGLHFGVQSLAQGQFCLSTALASCATRKMTSRLLRLILTFVVRQPPLVAIVIITVVKEEVRCTIKC